MQTMNNKGMVKDTIVTTRIRLDKECVMGIGCTRHTHHDTLTTYSENYDSICIDTEPVFIDSIKKESLVTLHIDKSQTPMIEKLQNKPAISPCNESSAQNQSNTSIIVKDSVKRKDSVVTANNTSDNGYVVDTLVLSFMTFLTIKYAKDSFNTWKKMIDELKSAVFS